MPRWLLRILTACALTALAAAEDVPKQVGPRTIEFRKALASVDRLEITPVNYSFSEQKPVSHVITGKEKIEELSGLLEFVETPGWGKCMCGGDYLIRFYWGERMVEQVSCHHGLRLRWEGGTWQGDAEFSPGVREAWDAWFDKNGYPAFADVKRREIEEKQKKRKALEDFLAQVPKEAAAAYRKMREEGNSDSFTWKPDLFASGTNPEPSPLELEFSQPFGDSVEAGLQLCRAVTYAHADGAYPWKACAVAFGLIDRRYHQEIYQAALTRPEESLGAADFFFGASTYKLLPENVDRLGLANAFARCELEHGSFERSKYAVSHLKEFSPEAARALEREIALGIVRAADDPEPYSLSRRADMILGLAREGDRSILPLIEAAERELRDKKDLAALAVARAYLGESGTIGPECLAADAMPVSFCALEILEARGDREALGIVIAGGVGSPKRWQRSLAVESVKRMTGKPWQSTDEGADDLVKEMSAIQAWWETERETWVPPSGTKP